MANTTRACVTTWLTSTGRLLRRDGALVGLETDCYESVRIEVAEARVAKATTDPEFVLAPNSIALALGQHDWTVVEPIEGRGPQRLEVETGKS